MTSSTAPSWSCRELPTHPEIRDMLQCSSHASPRGSAFNSIQLNSIQCFPTLCAGAGGPGHHIQLGDVKHILGAVHRPSRDTSRHSSALIRIRPQLERVRIARTCNILQLPVRTHRVAARTRCGRDSMSNQRNQRWDVSCIESPS